MNAIIANNSILITELYKLCSSAVIFGDFCTINVSFYLGFNFRDIEQYFPAKKAPKRAPI